MGEVTLTINSKNYSISCDEGQEQRVIDLSHYVDSKVKEMISAGAASSENHALVLASLVIADESFDLMENATTSQPKAAEVKMQALSPEQERQDAELATAIEKLAERIDSVANKMQDAA